MKLLILFLLSLYCCVAQYADGTVLVGDVGAKTVAITGSGLVGSVQTVTMPVGASQKFKVWFSIPGYPERGSESACAAPCGVSINTEYGRVSYWYEITDSSGNPLSPRLLSSQSYLAFTDPPTITAPFTVPATIHGFKDFKRNYQFNPGAVGTSGLRVWMRLFNPRPGDVSIVVNGTEHKLVTVDAVGLTSTGSVCTVTTIAPHNFTLANPVAQLWGFPQVDRGFPGVNGFQTITSVPTPTTFTFACSLSSGNWYTLNSISGVDLGAQVSTTNFYADEKGYFNGFNGVHGQSFEVMVPLGSGEIVASANNTISPKFNGIGDVSLHGLVHGYYTDFEVIQPDIEMTQIVVSGASATATTTGSHGYSDGDTILLRDAPGPRCFNGRRVITSHTSTTFTFTWGPDINGGQIACTVANGTYVVPTSSNTTAQSQPHMYAAKCLIPASSYQAYNPASFPIFGGNASNGSTIWHTATLKEPNGYFPGHASQSHCNSCHATNGNDLKYFAYDPYVIKIASIHRGLTEPQANDVVAYIASLSTAYSGKPWDPPYQPAPGLDSGTAANWTAGGGLDWCMTYDADTKTYLVPSGSYSQWVINGTVNARETATSRCLQPWNVWLPDTAPEDYWRYVLNGDFHSTTPWTIYSATIASPPSNFSTYQSSGTFFQTFLISFSAMPFAALHEPAAASQWPAQLAYQEYAAQKWMQLRFWEFMNVYGLQDFTDQAYAVVLGSPNARAGAQYTRGWLYSSAFQIGPHKRIMGGAANTYYNQYSTSIANWNYDTCRWYKTAMVINAGDRLATSSDDIDWNYNLAFEKGCGVPRPAFWEIELLSAIQPQSTWGLSTLNASGGNNMVLQNSVWNFPFTWGQTALFTSFTDQQNVVEAEAKQFLTASAAFTTGQWQAYWTQCPLSHTPSVSGGYNSAACPADSAAYGLAVMNTLGVDSTTKSGLITFYNAVFAASGYNFATAAAMTCTITTLGDYGNCS